MTDNLPDGGLTKGELAICWRSQLGRWRGPDGAQLMETNMMKAMKYATHGEQAHARALVRWLLSRNLSVSVYDGGDWTVIRGTDLRAILMALATTDCDELIASDSAGARKGWFQLIWGNDPDGSELVADCSANELCEEALDAIAGAY